MRAAESCGREGETGAGRPSSRFNALAYFFFAAFFLAAFFFAAFFLVAIVIS
jgi:hypothetical protein